MVPMKTAGATMPVTSSWRTQPSTISGGRAGRLPPRREQRGGEVFVRVHGLGLALRDDAARDVVEPHAANRFTTRRRRP